MLSRSELFSSFEESSYHLFDQRFGLLLTSPRSELFSSFEDSSYHLFGRRFGLLLTSSRSELFSSFEDSSYHLFDRRFGLLLTSSRSELFLSFEDSSYHLTRDLGSFSRRQGQSCSRHSRTVVTIASMIEHNATWRQTFFSWRRVSTKLTQSQNLRTL